MNSRQKILSVLEDIKQNSDINADVEQVRFDLNHRVVRAGILNNDEEARILCKLESWGYISLPLRRDTNIVTSVRDEEVVANRESVTITLSKNFNSKFFLYKLLTFKDNSWNYINPLWILVQIFKSLYSVFLIVWNKSKPLAVVISSLAALLVYDWTTAWKNIEYVVNLFQ